jgi:hypothetical protein
VIEKVLKLAPAGMVTQVARRDSTSLLLDSKTVVPPVGAGLLRLTVHVVSAPRRGLEARPSL